MNPTPPPGYRIATPEDMDNLPAGVLAYDGFMEAWYIPTKVVTSAPRHLHTLTAIPFKP